MRFAKNSACTNCVVAPIADAIITAVSSLTNRAMRKHQISRHGRWRGSSALVHAMGEICDRRRCENQNLGSRQAGRSGHCGRRCGGPMDCDPDVASCASTIRTVGTDCRAHMNCECLISNQSRIAWTGDCDLLRRFPICHSESYRRLRNGAGPKIGTGQRHNHCTDRLACQNNAETGPSAGRRPTKPDKGVTVIPATLVLRLVTLTAAIVRELY